MKVLAVGDIVGSAGINELKLRLKEIKEKENIDFTIVNGENSAEGRGITEKNFNDIISQGVDCVTMGNHTWGKKDIFKFIKRENEIDDELVTVIREDEHKKFEDKISQNGKLKGVDYNVAKEIASREEQQVNKEIENEEKYR